VSLKPGEPEAPVSLKPASLKPRQPEAPPARSPASLDVPGAHVGGLGGQVDVVARLGDIPLTVARLPAQVGIGR
jgi:hypothetical protein